MSDVLGPTVVAPAGQPRESGAARGSLLCLRLVLLLASLGFLTSGIGVLAAHSQVTYTFHGHSELPLPSTQNTPTCQRAVAALAGRGTDEPKDFYSVLKIDLGVTYPPDMWSQDNHHCVSRVRQVFGLGLCLLVVGGVLFVVRRRLPGRLREIRPRANRDT